jgi:hypothetical protein
MTSVLLAETELVLEVLEVEETEDEDEPVLDGPGFVVAR